MFTEEHIIQRYCMIEDIVNYLNKEFLPTNLGRKSKISKPICLLLMVLKQESQIPTTKKFYEWAKVYFKNDLRETPSYQQFCKGFENNFSYFVLIMIIITRLNKKDSESIFIIDSTLIPLCSNKHRYQSKLGKNISKSGKNVEGWCFGFKIHAIINHNMEIVSFKITPANASDIGSLDNLMIAGLKGYLIGDKGYINQGKLEKFLNMGLKLVTPVRKNMKKMPIIPFEAKIYKLRSRVETVWSVLKERLNLVYRYARSITSYFSHVLASLVAYSLRSKKYDGKDLVALLDKISIS